MCVQKSVVLIRRPEAIKEVCFVHCCFFPLFISFQRRHIKENKTARFQEYVELVQYRFSLCGAECAEIAHDHQDEMKAVLCFKFQIVLIYIMDGQPLPGRNFLRVLDRSPGKVYPGYICLLFRQPRRIQSRAATKVCNLYSSPNIKNGRLSTLPNGL